MTAPGDTIRQRYQKDASSRLVLAFTCWPGVLLVWDENARTALLVHGWSHDIWYVGNRAERQRARRLRSSPDVAAQMAVLVLGNGEADGAEP